MGTRDISRTLRVGLLLLLTLLALSGCARYVVTDFDREARFADFQNYVFVNKNESGDEQFQTLDASRIENALTRELDKQGMAQMDSRDEADTLIRYWIEDSKRTESTGFSTGIGIRSAPFGFGVATSPSSREIVEGKLIVEVVDAESRRVAWRATGQRNLNEQMSPDRRTELIDRIVREMFDRYPPAR